MESQGRRINLLGSKKKLIIMRYIYVEHDPRDPSLFSLISIYGILGPSSATPLGHVACNNQSSHRVCTAEEKAWPTSRASSL
jgi:hypothetical protein